MNLSTSCFLEVYINVFKLQVGIAVICAVKIFTVFVDGYLPESPCAVRIYTEFVADNLLKTFGANVDSHTDQPGRGPTHAW